MKPLFLILCISSLVYSIEPVSLIECQQAALNHSERLSIAELQILIAHDKEIQIQGVLNPKLSVDGSFSIRGTHPGGRRANPLAQLPLPFPMPKESVTITDRKHSISTKTSLVVPLCDFGKIPNAAMAQRSSQEASFHDKDRCKQDILLLTASHFYHALEAEALLKVVNESIAVLSRQQTISSKLFSLGMVTKNDVVAAEVQLAEREQERIHIQNNMQQSLDMLSRITARSFTSIDQLQDVPQTISWERNCSSLIEEAYRVHPALKKLTALNRAAHFDYKSAQAQNYPTIIASADFSTTSNPYALHKQWVSTGIGIQIPIFDGGIPSAKMAEKRRSISISELALQKEYKDIEVAIQQAFLSTDSAYRTIPIAERAVMLAEESLSMTKEQFAEGLLSIDDILNAEQRLAAAKSHHCQALYTFYMANVSLDYVAGLLHIPHNDGT